jgi:hypothetical protein
VSLIINEKCTHRVNLSQISIGTTSNYLFQEI